MDPQIAVQPTTGRLAEVRELRADAEVLTARLDRLIARLQGQEPPARQDAP